MVSFLSFPRLGCSLSIQIKRCKPHWDCLVLTCQTWYILVHCKLSLLHRHDDGSLQNVFSPSFLAQTRLTLYSMDAYFLHIKICLYCRFYNTITRKKCHIRPKPFWDFEKRTVAGQTTQHLLQFQYWILRQMKRLLKIIGLYFCLFCAQW